MNDGERAKAVEYLRATATNRRAPELMLPRDPGTRTIFHRAFEAAVRRRFPRSTPVSEISRSVLTAARRHPTVQLPVMDAEMLVRDALGEAVPIEDITPQTALTAYVVLFAQVADEMALTDAEIDELIDGAYANDPAVESALFSA